MIQLARSEQRVLELQQEKGLWMVRHGLPPPYEIGPPQRHSGDAKLWRSWTRGLLALFSARSRARFLL